MRNLVLLIITTIVIFINITIFAIIIVPGPGVESTGRRSLVGSRALAPIGEARAPV